MLLEARDQGKSKQGKSKQGKSKLGLALTGLEHNLKFLVAFVL